MQPQQNTVYIFSLRCYIMAPNQQRQHRAPNIHPGSAPRNPTQITSEKLMRHKVRAHFHLPPHDALDERQRRWSSVDYTTIVLLLRYIVCQKQGMFGMVRRGGIWGHRVTDGNSTIIIFVVQPAVGADFAIKPFRLRCTLYDLQNINDTGWQNSRL